MKSFGETIRGMRESRGLLLREVSAKLDIDPSHWSRVENGTKRPSREQVVALANYFHEDKDALLVLYLGERVAYELKDEENLAIEAIMAAEKLIRYSEKTLKGKRRRRGKEI